jgi:CheY-like chemotaxis protein
VGAGAGLGLGLAISKQLVELQHGMLAATSPGLGQGSTFSVTLPAAGRERSPAIAPSVATLPHRLVVVDDDRRVLDALSLLLERVGATVVTAASAEDARRAIAEATPELVLCDIAMPGEDGYTLIAGLRAAGVRVPAIALTAHAMEADAARAIAAGFDAHVAKPIDFERLVAKIAQLIAERP